MAKRKFECQFHGQSSTYCCGNCDEVTIPEIKLKLDTKRQKYLEKLEHTHKYVLLDMNIAECECGHVKEGLYLDRINNDLGYSPKNCRFTTNQKNCRNQRRTIWVKYNGVQ